MPLNPNAASIVYQATTRLLDLVTGAIRTRNRVVRKENYAKAAKIRYLLKGYNMYPTYISVDNANQILQCLINASGIQEFATPPSTPTPSNPAAGSLLVGEQGPPGPRGNDGGGTDFIAIDVNGNTVVDTFPLGSAYAARWDYIVNGTAQRAGTIYATWTEDGSLVSTPAEAGTDDVNGSTLAVSFTVTVVAGNVRLNANVTSGLWDIRGTRYLIPNQGAGVNPVTAPLANGNVWIGNASNLPVANPITGDIAITNTGVASISSGVIVDGDINASAGISLSKLASVPDNNSVVLSNGSGKLTSLANGSAGQVLTITGGVPTWAAPGVGGTVTSVNVSGGSTGLSFSGGPITTNGTITAGGVLGYANGGTGQSFYAQGDLIYASAANTLAKRAIGTFNQVLTVSGAVPVWSSNITVSNVTTAFIQFGATVYRLKTINIGTWNMDTTGVVAVAHGEDATNILACWVMIISDAGLRTPLEYSFLGQSSGGYSITTFDVNLIRTDSGFYDNTNYDSGSNRGTITMLITQ